MHQREILTRAHSQKVYAVFGFECATTKDSGSGTHAEEDLPVTSAIPSGSTKQAAGSTNQEVPLRRGLAGRLFAPRHSLSGKVMGLTLLVVMLTEVFIYVPSIARYRLAWLEERLA